MGSCFAGNFEEFLAFIPLVIGITVAMGFDSLTGIGLVFCAAASGYAGAVTNPFTVGVAQGYCGASFIFWTAAASCPVCSSDFGIDWIRDLVCSPY